MNYKIVKSNSGESNVIISLKDYIKLNKKFVKEQQLKEAKEDLENNKIKIIALIQEIVDRLNQEKARTYIKDGKASHFDMGYRFCCENMLEFIKKKVEEKIK